MKKLLLLLISFILFSIVGYTQTPTFSYGNPITSTGKIQYVFGANAVNGSRSQFAYNPGVFGPGVSGIMAIKTLYFFADTTIADTITFNNINITMGEFASAPGTAFSWNTSATNQTQVISATNIALVIKDSSWFAIELTTPYIYDPSKYLMLDISVGGQTPFSSVWNVRSTAGLGYVASSSQTAGTPNVLGGGSSIIVGIDPVKGLNNAGIQKLILPSICANNQDADVKIRNNGTNVINTVTVGWSINGVVQTPILLNGPIDTFGSVKNDTIITLGSVSFITGPQTIKAWTSMPNSATDPFAGDDTIVFMMSSALAGNYTVGNTGNFPTVESAVNAVVAFGVCGPTTFLVDSGTYFGQINITGRVNGSSATNTITFKGVDRDKTILSWAALAVNSKHVIKLQNTAYFTFRDLTIKPTGATNAWGIHMLDSCLAIKIKNCVIDISSAGTSTGAANTVGITVSGNPTGTCIPGPCATGLTVASRADSLEIDSNIFLYGYEAINIYGNTTTNKGKHNYIRNNTILHAYQNSINLFGQENIKVENNFIVPRPSGVAAMGTGVFCSGILTAQGGLQNIISGNKIHGTSTAGISINASNNTDTTNKGLITNNMIGGLNQAIDGNAVYIIDSRGWSVAHNTLVNDFNGTNAITASCLRVLGTSTHISVKNNIMSVSKPGTALPLHILNATNVDSMDRNIFYRKDITNNQVLHFGGTNYLLTTFKGGGGANTNSVFTSVLFKNDTNFALQNTCNFPSGQALSYVANDINGTIRGNPPIVGAIESSASPNNIALVTIQQPVSPIVAGPQTISVLIQNIGANAINTFHISYSINGGAPVTQLKTLVSPLSPCDSTIATITGLNFGVTDTMIRLQIYTDSPNALTDADATNDTLSTKLYSPLGGVYTLGGASADFATFADATFALKSAGLKSAVTFVVNPGNYTEQVVVSGPIAGLSPSNTITFDGVDNTTRSVTFAGNAGAPATFKIDNVKYVTVKNLGVYTMGNAWGYGLHITGTANNSRVKNCYIAISGAGATNTTINYNPLVISGATPTTAVRVDSLEIDSNTLVNGYYGLTIYAATGAANVGQFNKIRKNTITNAQQYGMYLVFQQSPEVLYNTVSCRSASGGVGIFCQNVTTPNTPPFTNISGNKIFSYGTAGISLNSSTNTLNTLKGRITNNAIGGQVRAVGANSIYLTSSSNWFIAHNSINHDFATTTNINAAAIRIVGNATASPGNTIINNAIAVTGSGPAVPVYTQVATNVDTFDYNLLYRADTFSNNVVVYLGANVNMPAFKSGVHNKNSVFYKLGYTAITDLTPNPADSITWSLNGRARHHSFVTTDINGNPRPANQTKGVPDIGAYEFKPTALPPLAKATPDTIIGGTTQVFTFATDTVAKIAWPSSYSGPSAMGFRQFSGEIPFAADTNFNYMYSYVSATPTPVVADSIIYYYKDIWRGTHVSESGIIFSRSDSGSNVWSPSFGSNINVTNNTLSYAPFGTFFSCTYLSGSDGLLVVPVKLVLFTATKQTNGIELNWKTSSEKNSSHFIVERLNSKNQWQQIAKLNAAGNSMNIRNYSYNDAAGLLMLNTQPLHYRLKMVDINSEFAYSTIATIHNKPMVEKTIISVYPNPFKNNINIELQNTQSDKAQIEVYDMMGKLILKNVMPISNNLVTLSLSAIENGFYFMTVTIDGVKQTQKIVKQ